ncbi:RusA family crossover junction endodeoxyribonuclease [Alicyclobacillus shizuokensis]|uniref:RusA family crossover junction endodeoxyribonuclease n=1 Tax=Alicyclobacillus shizuokensis TaxID=392014 RepID=UPI00083594F6|nr:RusA family crossover junction endodeoxyribonuclease [Alicyclobacillus shizuokensis]
MLVPLELPMMMYGKYKTSWYVNDPSGATDPRTGKPKKVKKTKIVEHLEERGDPGFYPSVNHIYQNIRGGGKKLTKAAEQLLAKWRSLAKAWAEEVGWECTHGEKVIVEVTAFFPDNQKRDTSNVYKLMMDALEGVIYDDDYYALPRTMDFQVLPKDSAKRPYFRLHIYKKTDEDLHGRQVAGGF